MSIDRNWLIAGGILAGAALAAWCWVVWAGDASDGTPWTDAGQPPDMIRLPLVTVPGRRAGYTGAPKCYPESLSGWDDSVIGDC